LATSTNQATSTASSRAGKCHSVLRAHGITAESSSRSRRPRMNTTVQVGISGVPLEVPRLATIGPSRSSPPGQHQRVSHPSPSGAGVTIDR
jgi:hypothetical protein